jgi:hypothetical protein
MRNRAERHQEKVMNQVSLTQANTNMRAQMDIGQAFQNLGSWLQDQFSVGDHTVPQRVRDTLSNEGRIGNLSLSQLNQRADLASQMATFLRANSESNTSIDAIAYGTSKNTPYIQRASELDDSAKILKEMIIDNRSRAQIDNQYTSLRELMMKSTGMTLFEQLNDIKESL